MKISDKERIINRYNERLQKFGPTIDALASGNLERHNLRFKIITEVGFENGHSILDLGCGFGDYYEYLIKNDRKIEYTGYDINENLIENAGIKFPDVHFETKDILQEDFPVFDYIVSSACFNLPLTEQNNYDFITELLQVCYKHARHGIAIDFNSSYVDFFSKEGFHYEPEKVFAIAKQITKRVALRHDYELFEFCIYMYKDFEGWSK